MLKGRYPNIGFEIKVYIFWNCSQKIDSWKEIILDMFVDLNTLWCHDFRQISI